MRVPIPSRSPAFVACLAAVAALAGAGIGVPAEADAQRRAYVRAHPVPIDVEELRGEPFRAEAAGPQRPCTLPSFIPPVGWGIRTLYADPNLPRPSGGAGVKVGVIDTGVSPHPDLVRRLVKCVDLTPPTNLPPCADSMNHGTLVASVIAADGGADGLGMWGMAPEASIYSYRVCEPTRDCWAAYIVDAIHAAIADGVNIINVSLAVAGHDAALQAALADAVAHNILVVVAAGNSPPYSYVGYPAAYPEVVSVGAIQENLQPWPYTASGINDADYIREDNEVEVAAPGAAVLAAMKSGCWVLGSGTSLAAPLVSGLAARLWNGDAAATRTLLQRAARFRDLHVAGNDTLTGFGLPTLRDFSGLHVISTSATPGGTVFPGGGVAVSLGATQTFSIAASNDCHALEDVEVDGVSQGPVASYTFTDVRSDHTIRAVFRRFGPHTIVASAGPAGSISPGGATLVACGGTQSFSITAPPDCGEIVDVKVDGVSQGPISSYTFRDVRSDHTIEATISAASTHTITATVFEGGGGTITPSGAVTVPCGGTQTFRFKPTTFCNTVAEVIVDGAITGPRTSHTFSDVRSDHTLVVAFDYAFLSTIGATATPGGTITPGGNIAVPCGLDRTFTITPTPDCGTLERVKIDAVWQGPITSHTFVRVTTDRTIHAEFSRRQHTLTATAGPGGAISPNGAANLPCGTNRTYTITPADCHRIQDVKVNGVSQGPTSSYTFNNLSASHRIEATFSPLEYTITANPGPGAAITPGGPGSVTCGGSRTYLIAPADPCRVIEDVLVDDVSLGAVASYTFQNVRGDHTITATTAPSGLALAETHTGASFGGVADGAIHLTVSGGVPPYAYAWSHGATSEDVAGLAAGTYDVAVTDAQGCVGRLGVVIDNLGPSELAISRPAPNPTSGALRVRFGTPAEAAVRLSVLDVQGREVAVLADGIRAPGWSWASWNGVTDSGPAPSGIYFLRLVSGGRQIVQRFMLVR